MGLKIDLELAKEIAGRCDVDDVVRTTLEDRIVMIEGMIRASGIDPLDLCLVQEMQGTRWVTRFERLDRMKDAGSGI